MSVETISVGQVLGKAVL